MIDEFCRLSCFYRKLYLNLKDVNNNDAPAKTKPGHHPEDDRVVVEVVDDSSTPIKASAVKNIEEKGKLSVKVLSEKKEKTPFYSHFLVFLQKGRKRKRPPSAAEVAPSFDSVSVDEWSNACRYRCPMCPDGGEKEEGGPPFRFASQSSLREHVHSAHRGVLGADVNLSDFVAGCRTDTRCAEDGNISFLLLFPLVPSPSGS